ncbi:MAG: hypothetical protein ABI551_10245, partial [Polyangiaceae bacterium]
AEEAPAGTVHLVPLLREAMVFEDTMRNDVLAAHRFAASALRLAPSDAATGADYRRIAAKIPGHRVTPTTPTTPTPTTVVEAPITAVGEIDEAVLDARVDVLSRKLQADASNEAVADELAATLKKLGRDMELFALVTARVEDAPDDDTRGKWLPRQIDVLARLEASARSAGDERGASFYAEARTRIGG